MGAMKYLVIAAVGLLGCGSAEVEGADASTDSSLTDSPSPKDQSVADSKVDSAVDGGIDAPVDAPVDSGDDAIVDSGNTSDAGCAGPSDCKLFASYCSTAPCECLPLGKNESNPVCTGQTVKCLIDPCAGKTAICSGAKCAVGK